MNRAEYRHAEPPYRLAFYQQAEPVGNRSQVLWLDVKAVIQIKHYRFQAQRLAARGQ